MPSRVGRQKGGWIAEVAEACGYLPCATNGVSCATIRDYWIFFRFDTMTHPNAVLRWLAGFISSCLFLPLQKGSVISIQWYGTLVTIVVAVSKAQWRICVLPPINLRIHQEMRGLGRMQRF